MRYDLWVCVVLLSLVGIRGATAQSQRMNLGTPLTDAALKPFDIDARTDGAGLPPGRGTVKEGETLFAQDCAACHGAIGEHPISPSIRLTGGNGTLNTPTAVQIVGSCWPYASTLYDYIQTAMPFNAPQSLNPDQVYAVTAYILHLNGIVSEDQTLDAVSLPKVHMPNESGFVAVYPLAK